MCPASKSPWFIPNSKSSKKCLISIFFRRIFYLPFFLQSLFGGPVDISLFHEWNERERSFDWSFADRYTHARTWSWKVWRFSIATLDHGRWFSIFKFSLELIWISPYIGKLKVERDVLTLKVGNVNQRFRNPRTHDSEVELFLIWKLIWISNSENLISKSHIFYSDSYQSGLWSRIDQNYLTLVWIPKSNC